MVLACAYRVDVAVTTDKVFVSWSLQECGRLVLFDSFVTANFVLKFLDSIFGFSFIDESSFSISFLSWTSFYQLRLNFEKCDTYVSPRLIPLLRSSNDIYSNICQWRLHWDGRLDLELIEKLPTCSQILRNASFNGETRHPEFPNVNFVSFRPKNISQWDPRAPEFSRSSKPIMNLHALVCFTEYSHVSETREVCKEACPIAIRRSFFPKFNPANDYCHTATLLSNIRFFGNKQSAFALWQSSLFSFIEIDSVITWNTESDSGIQLISSPFKLNSCVRKVGRLDTLGLHVEVAVHCHDVARHDCVGTNLSTSPALADHHFLVKESSSSRCSVHPEISKSNSFPSSLLITFPHGLMSGTTGTIIVMSNFTVFLNTTIYSSDEFVLVDVHPSFRGELFISIHDSQSHMVLSCSSEIGVESELDTSNPHPNRFSQESIILLFLLISVALCLIAVAILLSYRKRRVSKTQLLSPIS
jgi:hypothetical protein